ncbi:23S rRNA (pseudouridine(1915)-N(3))-methyltransferase RlmH [Mesorhizobium sp. SB112]|jgi:23S rRNA (pseudouridine1915-N3)-methyltransferase|uniref:23S rRNA (pseudouridine(1915)-N(3))-methyltransferase RlmH n=1 Tax=Mesorhizobium sp. SB112 TaxID=3151853 RepID=UPI0032633017
MRLSIHAVGRMKAGPERELADRYFDRLGKSGASVGLDFTGVVEIAESRARDADERKRDEAAKLQAAPGSVLWLLDERGKNISSEDFAGRLGALCDQGARGLTIAIGGPDGHDAALRQQADFVLSFGALTWPHQIVRVLLAEQLYRATTILSGHPYHRS